MGNDDSAEKFLIEEYKGLTKQIEKLLQETNLLAKYALIGTVSVWAWLAKDGGDFLRLPNAKILWWLPFGLCIMLFFRAWFITELIIELGAFVGKIEKAFGVPKDLSWEYNVAKQRSSVKFLERNSRRAISAVIYWLILCIGTLVLPFYIIHYDRIKASYIYAPIIVGLLFMVYIIDRIYLNRNKKLGLENRI